MSCFVRWAAPLLVFGLVACGGKSIDDAEPSGGGSGGTSVGGTGQGGAGANGGTAIGGTAIGGTAIGGSPSDCARFDDETQLYIRVSIANKTLGPIYLGPTTMTCDTTPLFTVADAAGQPLPALGSFRYSCASARQQGDAGVPGICLISDGITLQPGETLFTAWDGFYAAHTLLPRECSPRGEGNLMCVQAKTIRPGVFTFSAQAGSSLDCFTSSSGCNACVPDSQGGCKTSGVLIAGALRQAVARVELDESYGVFPQSGAAGDAAPGGAAVLSTVELIFTE